MQSGQPISFQRFLIDRPALQNRDAATQKKVYNAYLDSFYAANPVSRAEEILPTKALLGGERRGYRPAPHNLQPQLGSIKEEKQTSSQIGKSVSNAGALESLPKVISLFSQDSQAISSKVSNVLDTLSSSAAMDAAHAFSESGHEATLPPRIDTKGEDNISSAIDVNLSTSKGRMKKPPLSIAELSKFKMFGPRKDAAVFEFARRGVMAGQQTEATTSILEEDFEEDGFKEDNEEQEEQVAAAEGISGASDHFIGAFDSPDIRRLEKQKLSQDSAKFYSTEISNLQGEDSKDDISYADFMRNCPGGSSNTASHGGLELDPNKLPAAMPKEEIIQLGITRSLTKPDIPYPQYLRIDGSAPHLLADKVHASQDAATRYLDKAKRDPQIRELFSMTTLLAVCSACFYNDLEYLKALESQLISTDKSSDSNYDGLRPLYLKDEPQLLSFVLSQADFDKRTPMHVAALAGQKAATEYLISKNASLNTLDRIGRTPLDAAIASGNSAVADVIRSAGGWTAAEMSLFEEDEAPAAVGDMQAEGFQSSSVQGSESDRNNGKPFNGASHGNSPPLGSILGVEVAYPKLRRGSSSASVRSLHSLLKRRGSGLKKGTQCQPLPQCLPTHGSQEVDSSPRFGSESSFGEGSTGSREYADFGEIGDIEHDISRKEDGNCSTVLPRGEFLRSMSQESKQMCQEKSMEQLKISKPLKSVSSTRSLSRLFKSRFGSRVPIDSEDLATSRNDDLDGEVSPLPLHEGRQRTKSMQIGIASSNSVLDVGDGDKEEEQENSQNLTNGFSHKRSSVTHGSQPTYSNEVERRDGWDLPPLSGRRPESPAISPVIQGVNAKRMWFSPQLAGRHSGGRLMLDLNTPPNHVLSQIPRTLESHTTGGLLGDDLNDTNIGSYDKAQEFSIRNNKTSHIIATNRKSTDAEYITSKDNEFVFQNSDTYSNPDDCIEQDYKSDASSDSLPESEHTLAFLMCGAATQGDLQLLADLLFHGANPNATDVSGRTPLHLAAARAQTSAAKFLLEALADPSAVDAFGRTPLEEAVRSNSSDIVAIIHQVIDDKKEESLENKNNYKGVVDSTLYIRKKQDFLSESVKYSPFNGAAASASLKLMSSIVEACRSGDVERAEVLLEQGKSVKPQVDIQTLDYEGRTLLFHAVESRSEPMVKYLLENNVNPTTRDSMQLTSYYIARLLRLNKIADLIVEAVRSWEARKSDGQLIHDYPANVAHVTIDSEETKVESETDDKVEVTSKSEDAGIAVHSSPQLKMESKLSVFNRVSSKFDWPSGDVKSEEALLQPIWVSQAAGALRYRPTGITYEYYRAQLQLLQEPIMQPVNTLQDTTFMNDAPMVKSFGSNDSNSDEIDNSSGNYASTNTGNTSHSVYIDEKDDNSSTRKSTLLQLMQDELINNDVEEEEDQFLDHSSLLSGDKLHKCRLWFNLGKLNGKVPQNLQILSQELHPIAFGAFPQIDAAIFFAQRPWLMPDTVIPAPTMSYIPGHYRGWRNIESSSSELMTHVVDGLSKQELTTILDGKVAYLEPRSNFVGNNAAEPWLSESSELTSSIFAKGRSLALIQHADTSSIKSGSDQSAVVLSPPSWTSSSTEEQSRMDSGQFAEARRSSDSVNLIDRKFSLDSLSAFPIRPWPLPPPRFTSIVALESQVVELKVDLWYGCYVKSRFQDLKKDSQNADNSPCSALPAVLSPASSSPDYPQGNFKLTHDDKEVSSRFKIIREQCVKPVSPFKYGLMCRFRAHARMGLYIPAFRRAVAALLPRLAARFNFAHVEWLIPSISNSSLEVFTDAAGLSVDAKPVRIGKLLSGHATRVVDEVEFQNAVSEKELLNQRALSQAFHQASCYVDIPLYKSQRDKTLSIESVAFNSLLPMVWKLGAGVIRSPKDAGSSTKSSMFMSLKVADDALVCFSRENLAVRCGFDSVTAFPILGDDGQALGVLCAYTRKIGQGSESDDLPCLMQQRHVVESLSRFAIMLWRLLRLGGSMKNSEGASESGHSTSHRSEEYCYTQYSRDLEDELVRLMDKQSLVDKPIEGMHEVPINTGNDYENRQAFDQMQTSQSISCCRNCFITSRNIPIGRSHPMWYLGVLIAMGAFDPLSIWLSDMDSESHRAAAKVLPLLLMLKSSLSYIEDNLWNRCEQYLIHRAKFLYAVSPRIPAGSIQMIDVRQKLRPAIQMLVRSGCWFSQDELACPNTFFELEQLQNEEQSSVNRSLEDTQQNRRFANVWVFNSSPPPNYAQKSNTPSSLASSQKISPMSSSSDVSSTGVLIEELKVLRSLLDLNQPRPWFGCLACTMCESHMRRQFEKGVTQDIDLLPLHREITLTIPDVCNKYYCTRKELFSSTNAELKTLSKGIEANTQSVMQIEKVSAGVLEELISTICVFGPSRSPSPALLSVRRRAELVSAMRAYVCAPEAIRLKALSTYTRPSLIAPPKLGGWDLYDVLGPQGSEGADLPCDEEQIYHLSNEFLKGGANFQLTSQYIRKLHITLHLSSDVSKGSYRKQSTVGSFQFYRFYRCFAPPEEIPEALESLCEAFNDHTVRSLPAIVRAHHLYATLIYVIHPFEDGNGRLGRLLANLVLKQAGFPWAIDHLAKVLTLEGLLQLIAKKGRRT